MKCKNREKKNSFLTITSDFGGVRPKPSTQFLYTHRGLSENI